MPDGVRFAIEDILGLMAGLKTIGSSGPACTITQSSVSKRWNPMWSQGDLLMGDAVGSGGPDGAVTKKEGEG